MGLEAKTQARIGGRWQDASAQLEEKEIVLRGPVRLRIPLERAKEVRARGGLLTLTHEGQEIALRLGEQAERWAARITRPPSRLDKLGVKTGQRVRAIGLESDGAFLAELRARGAAVTARGAADLVFFRIATARELVRLAPLTKAIAPDGAIWVLWPKGGKDLREDDVRGAALALTLVDVKVVSFSDALSGLKLVIRKPLRPRAKPAPRLPAPPKKAERRLRRRGATQRGEARRAVGGMAHGPKAPVVIPPKTRNA